MYRLPLGAVAPLLLVACASVSRESPSRPVYDPPSPRAAPPRWQADRLFGIEDGLITSLAEHGSRLYFTAPKDEQIWAIPKRGGRPVAVVVGERFASAPAFDGEFAYFIDESGDIQRASVESEAVETLAAAWAVDAVLRAAPPDPHARRWSHRRDRAILPPAPGVDDESVYWVEYRGTYAVLKVSKSGGSPVALVEGLLNRPELAVGANEIYVATDPVLYRMNKAAPGQLQALAPDRESGMIHVARTDEPLFWSRQRGRLFGLEPGSPRLIQIPDRQLPPDFDELRILGDTAFFTRNEERSIGGGRIGYVGSRSLRGGTPRMVWGEHGWTTSLVVDAEAVYFVNVGPSACAKAECWRDDCSIWRAPR